MAAANSGVGASGLGIELPVIWRITLTGIAGDREGELVLEINDDPLSPREGSCVGLHERQTRHVKIRSLAGKLFKQRRDSSSLAVALIGDGKVTIDLTAGVCDAYFLLDGKLTPEGASGDVVISNLGGSRSVGHFLARRAAR